MSTAGGGGARDPGRHRRNRTHHLAGSFAAPHLTPSDSDTHHSELCRRLFLSDGTCQQRCRRHGSTPIGIGAQVGRVAMGRSSARATAPSGRSMSRAVTSSHESIASPGVGVTRNGSLRPGATALRSTILTSRSRVTRGFAVDQRFYGQIVRKANDVVKQSVRSCQSSLHLDNSSTNTTTVTAPQQWLSLLWLCTMYVVVAERNRFGWIRRQAKQHTFRRYGVDWPIFEGAGFSIALWISTS